MSGRKQSILPTGIQRSFSTGLLSLILIAAGFQSAAQNAQNVKVNGGFLSDSLKIGEQTAFYLSAHYPRNLTVLFPDSTFSFLPFEYEKRNYFATKTENGISTDSAVYYLTTFEIDRVQYLHLPVFVVQAHDSTQFESPQDSVLIIQLVAHVPDSLSADKLPLKMNTAYQKVFFRFNVWAFVIAIGLLLLVIALVWIFFGKKIRIYLREKRMKKNHIRFVQAYESALGKLRTAVSSIHAENALSIWKKYMEQLESRPYTKLTTRETFTLLKDEMLGRNLSAIDSAIYGHNKVVVEPLEKLKYFADQRFSKKLEEIKHGK